MVALFLCQEQISSSKFFTGLILGLTFDMALDAARPNRGRRGCNPSKKHCRITGRHFCFCFCRNFCEFVTRNLGHHSLSRWFEALLGVDFYLFERSFSGVFDNKMESIFCFCCRNADCHRFCESDRETHFRRIFTRELVAR